jgi:hypothetical protein
VKLLVAGKVALEKAVLSFVVVVVNCARLAVLLNESLDVVA